jgi:hypothetical protein
MNEWSCFRGVEKSPRDSSLPPSVQTTRNQGKNKDQFPCPFPSVPINRMRDPGCLIDWIDEMMGLVYSRSVPLFIKKKKWSKKKE